MPHCNKKEKYAFQKGEKQSVGSTGKTLSDLKRNTFNLFFKLGYNAGRFEQCYKKIELAKVYKNGGFNFPGRILSCGWRISSETL